MKSIKYYREESEKKKGYSVNYRVVLRKALLLSHSIRKRNFSDEVSGFTEKEKRGNFVREGKNRSLKFIDKKELKKDTIIIKF